MIDVHFTASIGDTASLECIERGLRRQLRLATRAVDQGLARLHLTSQPLLRPYVLRVNRGVVVSTAEGSNIGGYAGIELSDYLLIASLLALAQFRTLRENPLLCIEDFRHPAGSRCLFAGTESVTAFAVMLDPPVICRGCAEFYRCLGAESELLALQSALRDIFGPLAGPLATCAAMHRN